MSDDIVKAEQPGFLAPVVTVKDALLAYQAKKELIEHIFQGPTKENPGGVDYGTVPGSSKPTLLKAGAEKATSFFGLAPRFTDAEVINDWTGENHGGEPFFYYRRTCNLYRGSTLIVSVDGSCNSWEKKYRYRGGERVCPSCGKSAIKKSKFPPRNKELGSTPGWYCFDKAGGCGAEFAANDPAITEQQLGQVKNPDVADLVNTILKMADKRALVAATLIATGLSEYFTQDVEDYIDTTATDITTRPAQPKPEMTYEQAAAMEYKTASKTYVIGELNIDKLNYIIEKAKNPDVIEAARVVLKHDFQATPPAGPDVGDGENLQN